MGYLVSCLFFVSGIAGLVYEVVWAKVLALVLGNTAHAHTVVLATFLGGLAIGNALWGPRADRVRNRLRLYGKLEIGIGLLGLVSPYLLFWLSEGYVHVARQGGLSPFAAVSLRIFLSAAVLLPPTILMGGTLPALSRFATQSLGQVEGSVSWLYFLNSAGAVIGTLLAGFYLVPVHGLNPAVAMTGFLNIAIGLVCLFLRAREGALGVEERQAAAFDAVRPIHVQLTYVAIFLSGCVSLAYEIAWIRLLSLVLGSSTYSFTIMLAAFIAGLALGSWLIARRILPRISSYLLFGLAELGIGLSIVLTLPIYERLPYDFLNIAWLLNRTPATFYLFEGIKFLFCFSLMLLPTTFVGMTLPLASRIATQHAEEVGKKVGSVFSVNTIGNVLGVTAAGLILLPSLGIQTLIEAGVVVNLAVGGLILWTASQWRNRHKTAVSVVVLLILFLYRAVDTPWDQRILSSGEFRTREAPTYASYQEYVKAFETETLLYYKDDSNMTVMVAKNDEIDDIYLKVNGKIDATAKGDLATQILAGQLPLCLKPDAKDVLVVGLGSGITAGSVLRHPVEHVDMVEISSAVVEAERFFQPYNYNALQDPRLSLHIEDAKTMLKLTPRHYDVIISEPSNPWIAGTGNLFSVEFYREVLAHLKNDGLMVQWFHLYEMNDELFALILRTFSSVFKNVMLWDLQDDVLLVGSSAAIAVDFTRMKAVLRQQKVRDDLERIGISTLTTLLSLHMASDQSVRQMAGKGPVNSDFLPLLEYEAPKAFYVGERSELSQWHDERWFPHAQGMVLLTRYVRARNQPLSYAELKDVVAFHQENESTIATGLVIEWARRYPDDPEALWTLAQAQNDAEELEAAGLTMDRLLEIDPNNPKYLEAAADIMYQHYWQNQTYLTSIRPEKALHYYQRLLALTTDRQAEIQVKLAQVYDVMHDYQKALDTLESAARYAAREKESGEEPDAIWLAAAKIARKMDDRPLALDYAQRAVKHNPDNGEAEEIVNELSGSGAQD